MLSLQELEQHLEKITYKPGWNMRLVIDPFSVYELRQRVILAISFLVPNTYTDNPEEREEVKIGMRHILQGPFMTYDQFDRAVLDALDKCERHETREWFRVDGVMKYDPHKRRVGV